MDCIKTCLLAGLMALLLANGEARDYSSNVHEIYGRDSPYGEAPRVRRQHVDEPPRVRRQGGGHEGVTGPVHTYVKTDEHAHFKWGVRHNVGHEYAGRKR